VIEQESPTPQAPDTESLQRYLERHPDSPAFTALGAAYLHDGMPATALKIVEAGLEQYPDHPGAHLAAAKACIVLRRYNDARRYIDRLLVLVPGSGAAVALSSELQTLELRFPPSLSVSASESERTASAGTARHGRHRKRWSWEDHVIGGAFVLAPERSAPTEQSLQPAETAKTAVEDDPNDLEILAQRLEGARIPPVRESSTTEDTSVPREEVEAVEVHARPVTETLAHIYAQQGRHLEALAAYRELRERNPDRTYEFTLRIIELERLLSADASTSPGQT
jgi:tetratricopeptide (TPR) repeat protein